MYKIACIAYNRILCRDPYSLRAIVTYIAVPREVANQSQQQQQQKTQPYDNANDSSSSFTAAAATAAKLRSIQLVCLHIFYVLEYRHAHTSIRPHI